MIARRSAGKRRRPPLQKGRLGPRKRGRRSCANMRKPVRDCSVPPLPAQGILEGVPRTASHREARAVVVEGAKASPDQVMNSHPHARPPVEGSFTTHLTHRGQTLSVTPAVVGLGPPADKNNPPGNLADLSPAAADLTLGDSMLTTNLHKPKG